MSDVLDNKARFRLKYDRLSWTLEKSYYSDKGESIKWRADSYHPSLKFALRYLVDRLMAEGYETKGIAALLERLEAVEARVMKYGASIEKKLSEEGVETL